MRVYSASDEETLRARKLIADWAGEGFLTKEQYQHLEQDTVSGLRTTDIFLRLILFLFTLISVCAAVGLFYQVFFPHSLEQTSGVFLLIWAAISYAAAELAASQARLYRFGIEEALAVGSVGFLCIGMQLALFSGYRVLPPSDAAHSLVPAAGTVGVAVDLAPLRTLVRISRRNDFCSRAVGLLDLIRCCASCDDCSVFRGRAAWCSCTKDSPPLRLPRGRIFARRSISLARHLSGHQSQAVTVEPAD